MILATNSLPVAKGAGAGGVSRITGGGGAGDTGACRGAQAANQKIIHSQASRQKIE